jgi:hypothetical protein
VPQHDRRERRRRQDRRGGASNLEIEAGRARLWTWGWAGAGAAGTTVNAVLATQASYSDRVDRIGAASGTTMLTLTTLISPLSVPTADSAPGADQNDPCAAVVRAEQVLLSVAQDEADRQRFVKHLLPIGGSIAGGVVLGVGYDHWVGGAINAGIGIVVSEIKMLTQPMGGVRTLERYRSGVLTDDGPKLGWNVAPTVGKGGGGLALSLTY